MCGGGTAPPPSGVVAPLPVIVLNTTRPIGSPSAAIVAVNTQSNGAMAVQGTNSTIAVPAAWYMPLQPGIGSAYWVRLDTISGTPPTIGDTPGVWLLLSASRSWTWSQSPGNPDIASVCKLSLSTSATGTPIVSTSADFNVNITAVASVTNPIPSIVLLDNVLSGTTAVALMTFHNDGTVTVVDNGGGSTTAGNWYSPTTPGIGASYAVRITQLTGALADTGAPPGTWTAMTTNQTWGWTRSVLGTTSATVKIDIAAVGALGTVLATEASIPVTLIVSS